MGITEYFQVKELCIQGSKFVNGDAVDTTFPVLSRNRLVDENYWYRTILAKEFMEFFENLAGERKRKRIHKGPCGADLLFGSMQALRLCGPGAGD